MDLVPEVADGRAGEFSPDALQRCFGDSARADGSCCRRARACITSKAGAIRSSATTGLTFIENLQRDNHLEIDTGGAHCSVEFAYQRSADGSTCRRSDH